MSAPLLALIIAAVAGMAMAVQGSLNAVLSKVTGIIEATLVVHLVGSAVALLLLLGVRAGTGGLQQIQEAPWFSYLGGAIGVVIILAVVFSIPRVGVANATTAIIIGQVATAMLIDQLGLFGLERIPLSWWNGLGLAFLAAGGYFMLCR